MAQKAHTDFSKLIQILYKKQRKEWNSKPSSSSGNKTRIDLESIGGIWRFVDDKAFGNLPWNSDEDPTIFQSNKFVMLLPPLEKEASFVPVMSIEYHPSQEFREACLRIRVLMIRQEEKKLVGLGFRIESPERYCQDGEEEGIHDFYHAQLIKGIGYGPSIDVPDWLPCTQPSFPLWAVNPIDAIFNLILTLYGRKYYKEFLINSKIDSGIGTSMEFSNFHDRLHSS